MRCEEGSKTRNNANIKPAIYVLIITCIINIVLFIIFDNYYCFKDTVININVSPVGGVLTGNGINAYTFNPSEAGVGYHNIYYTYGEGDCSQVIDTVIFVDNKFESETYITDDTICLGELSSIGVNVSGGTSNYSFSWNNSTTTSFNQLVSPSINTSYIVTSSDGCSDDNIDTIDKENLHVSVGWFDSSVCFGEPGYEERETLENGLNTAAFSGFTGFCLNPNTYPLSDSIASISHLINSSINHPTKIHPISCLTINQEGKKMCELFDLNNHGAIGHFDYKTPIKDSGLLETALKYSQTVSYTHLTLPTKRIV